MIGRLVVSESVSDECAAPVVAMCMDACIPPAVSAFPLSAHPSS